MMKYILETTILGPWGKSKDFAAALEKAERDIYTKAYKYHKGNQSKTASALSVSRNTFRTKMKLWGLL